ncbi:intradiol ring-cleavage dioxygenase [Caulobacter sp. SL161]|uniref:dioxygenase family protein n=1 Tax=Caulobacter sp. SL161 TaxID=2995156 RepID=UPI00227561E9|nr:intradiol ring-cleavage dioxygenase [Caulobacter sp. SL161]MCY1647476.1 intradiol ring-cleavage dioxygenase [Caulobacter sp. SL161]
MADHNEDHPHGLQFDLEAIERQILQRRHVLGLLGFGGSAALLTACGGGGGGSSTSSATSTTSSSSSSTSSSSSSTSSSSTSSSTASNGSCVAEPETTNGPYPADGSNTSSGATSNVLTSSGIVRSDIRSSFITSTTVAAGLVTTIKIKLVDANNNCAPLVGYAIYFWHCTNNGLYSLYTVPTESYLRGVQVTDSNGEVTFTTIYPGCYSGRWPHIHFEVYKSLATATIETNALLTSQIAMPSAISSAVYNNVSGYSASISNLAQITLASDNVFRSFTAAQLAAATPTLTGDTTSGYSGTMTIGLGS